MYRHDFLPIPLDAAEFERIRMQLKHRIKKTENDILMSSSAYY